MEVSCKNNERPQLFYSINYSHKKHHHRCLMRVLYIPLVTCSKATRFHRYYYVCGNWFLQVCCHSALIWELIWFWELITLFRVLKWWVQICLLLLLPIYLILTYIIYRKFVFTTGCLAFKKLYSRLGVCYSKPTLEENGIYIKTNEINELMNIIIKSLNSSPKHFSGNHYTKMHT